MITIRVGKTNTQSDIMGLHTVLTKGLLEYTEKCDGYCKECNNKWVCRNVEDALQYLESLLKLNEQKVK